MSEDCYNPVCMKSEPQHLYKKFVPKELFLNKNDDILKDLKPKIINE
jgi:hypothetical protein